MSAKRGSTDKEGSAALRVVGDDGEAGREIYVVVPPGQGVRWQSSRRMERNSNKKPGSRGHLSHGGWEREKG